MEMTIQRIEGPNGNLVRLLLPGFLDITIGEDQAIDLQDALYRVACDTDTAASVEIGEPTSN